MCNNDSFQFSDITNPYTPVRDYSIYGERYSHVSKYRGESLIGESLVNLQIIICDLPT